MQPIGVKRQKLLVPNVSDKSIALQKGLPNPNRSNYSASLHVQPKAHFRDYKPVLVDDKLDHDDCVTEVEWWAAERQLMDAGKISPR